jgi:hypothetical protein
MNHPINFQSIDWVNTRLRLLDLEEILVQKLRDTSKNHDETQVIRGQLLVIKQILNWEKEPDNKSR